MQRVVGVLVLRPAHSGVAASWPGDGGLPALPPLHRVHRTVQGNLQDPHGHRAVAGVVREEHGGREAVLLILGRSSGFLGSELHEQCHIGRSVFQKTLLIKDFFVDFFFVKDFFFYLMSFGKTKKAQNY